MRRVPKPGGPSAVAALACVAALLLGAASAKAKPGDLDSSFGTKGRLVTSFARGSDDRATGVVVQPNGKIVAGGSSGGRFALTRYKPRGTLDRRFGSGGKVTTRVHGLSEAGGLARGKEGKIVVVGSAEGMFAVARYRRNGSLDRAFGHRGKLTTDFGPGEDAAFAVGLQRDGKIVAAGRAEKGAEFGTDFALARYRTNGELDPSFGAGGKVTTDFGGFEESVRGLAVQRDGKIVAAGWSGSGGTTLVALARYNRDGSLDTEFDLNGKVKTPAGGAWSVAVQPDGKIVLAGWAGAPEGFAVMRYKANGSIDRSFGKRGIAKNRVSDHADDVAVQPGGKIVAVGTYCCRARRSSFAVVRYRRDGSLDKSFGSHGIVTTAIGKRAPRETAGSVARAVVVGPGGKVTVAGYAWKSKIRRFDFALARYLGRGVSRLRPKAHH